VGTDDVVRVGTNSEMERILSGGLDDVLVGANTRSLEGLGRDLLVLVGNQVAAVKHHPSSSRPSQLPMSPELSQFFPLSLFMTLLFHFDSELATNQKGNSSTPAFFLPCLQQDSR